MYKMCKLKKISIIFIYLTSICLEFVVLDNETNIDTINRIENGKNDNFLDESVANQQIDFQPNNDQPNNDQPNNDLLNNNLLNNDQNDIPSIDSSNDYNTFNTFSSHSTYRKPHQIDNAMLNRYILENNNIYLPPNPDQINNQSPNYQTSINHNRSKVYIFKPKQIISETSYSDHQPKLEFHQNHHTLPTKSTLKSTFPKLYRQLYQLEQKSPLQRNLQQFFRSNMDNLSTDHQSNNSTRSIDAQRIEISTQTLQTVPLDQTYVNNVPTISTNFLGSQIIDGRLESFDFGQLKNQHKNQSYFIGSESSNRNETTLNQILMRNQLPSVVVDDLKTQTNRSTNGVERKRKLSYKDIKYLNPIEFKVMKLDKNKFNTKRYIPKIVYHRESNQNRKNKRYKSGTNDQNENKMRSKNTDHHQEIKLGNLKLIPLTYVIDESYLNQDNQNNHFITIPPEYYMNPSIDPMSIFYNLNSIDLIGTLIDNLITNLPDNIFDLNSNDLMLNKNGFLVPNNFPTILPPNNLVPTNSLVSNKMPNGAIEERRSDKRTKLRTKSNKLNKKVLGRKRIEDLKKEKTNQIKQLLNGIQIKELTDQLLQLNPSIDLNNDFNLIEQLKHNIHLKNILNNLSGLNQSKKSNSDVDKQSKENQSND